MSFIQKNVIAVLIIIFVVIACSEEISAIDDSPKVKSSTHPNSEKWYLNNNPVFVWDLPSDVTGVSYLITDKATSNPGPKSDGVVDLASFKGIADGTQYFNIKFKRGGTWGLIAHYQFNIDTVPPARFEIKTVAVDSIHSEITFETTDALSGIDHYEIKIGDSATWLTVSVDQAWKPYRLAFNKSGAQTVFVKAIDKAGNAITESASIVVPGIGVGSTLRLWVAKLFNSIVNGLSSYGLLMMLLSIVVGILILIYEFLGSSIDKLWHHLDNRHPVVIKKIKRTQRRIK